ncbi:MAG TPA: glycosyltransferase [Candidatus Binataceae bacterium]|jgi:ceramide glucosyltransferase
MILSVLHLLTIIGAMVSTGYYATATVTAIMFARRSKQPLPGLPKIAPRVAVLKPLHGESPFLLQNAVSFLESRYPRCEFVFGVTNYSDKACEVPVSLKPRYQFANVSLSVGEAPDASNRKIAKVLKMMERVPNAEIVVLSDDDIEVDQDYLRTIVAELCEDDRTAIVTCAYRARPGVTVGSWFESMSVNTDFAPMVLLSEAFEPLQHAFGATIAIKRKVLEEIGGFAMIKEMMADDYFLGKLVKERGYNVKLSRKIVTINADEDGFGEFFNHQVRWARTYRNVRPLSVGTILTHGPFWALALLLTGAFSAASIAMCLALIGVRIAMSAVVLSKVLKLPELLSDIWMVPIKDLVMTGVWFASFATNSVEWRGRRFRVRQNGTMEEVEA